MTHLTLCLWILKGLHFKSSLSPSLCVYLILLQRSSRYPCDVDLSPILSITPCEEIPVPHLQPRNPQSRGSGQRLSSQPATQNSGRLTLLSEALRKVSPAEGACPMFNPPQFPFPVSISNSFLAPMPCLLLLCYDEEMASFLCNPKLSSGLHRALGEEVEESLLVC